MAARTAPANSLQISKNHVQLPSISNGQPSSSSSKQLQNDTIKRFDTVLLNIRETSSSAAGKKSLKALGKRPENISGWQDNYARIDYDSTLQSDETVGTSSPSLQHNPTAAVGSGPGLYVDRFGTAHPVKWDLKPIVSSPTTSSHEKHNHLAFSTPDQSPQVSSPTTSSHEKRSHTCPPEYCSSHKPRSKEICRNYLNQRCTLGYRCHRYHPKRPQHSPGCSKQGDIDAGPENNVKARSNLPSCSSNSSPDVPSEGNNTATETDINESERPDVRSLKHPRQSLKGRHTIHNSKNSTTSVQSTKTCPLDLASKHDDVPSDNSNPRPSILSDLSENRWERDWGCHTDASTWSDTTESSTFSSHSSGSSRTSVAGDDPPTSSTPVRYPPPPGYPGVCRRWLQGRCELGHTCRWVHRDIEYDLPKHSKPPIASSYSFVVHDHIKVRFGAGFDTQEIVTGFESAWLHISKLPAGLTAGDVSRYLTTRGYTPQDIKMSTYSARVRFASHIDARNANTSLNGASQWGVTLSTQLAINNSSGRDVALRDTAVRIEWQAPGKVAYGGYLTLEKAEQALAIVNMEYRQTCVSARIHKGLPQVNRYTVQFQNLPVEADRKFMEKYANPVDVVWDDPNYEDLDATIAGIKRLLEYNGKPFLSFQVLPPPHQDGYIHAWAHFESPILAREATSLLHTRKPKCTGRTRMFAHHMQSLEYTIPLCEYLKMASDVIALRSLLWRSAKRNTTIVLTEKLNSMVVKLSADDIKELGQLKADFEKIRLGEALRKGQQIVWDGFFAQEDGMYLRDIERKNPGVVIKEDIKRRKLMLFGPLEKRETVKRVLLKKYEELNAMEQRIYLQGNLVGPFLNSELAGLRMTLGEENVRLDLWKNLLIVRGPKENARIALQAVEKVKNKQSGWKPMSTASCPVCSDDIDAPVPLRCGHTYCRACLINYFKAATDNRFFPLTCLGDNAKCGVPIPLSVPREIIPVDDFDNIVEAAFTAYIHARPKEFHYCPTPDCMQVYRSAPKGTVIQCPSCLLRICPVCHVEYHDGFDCPDKDSGDESFKKWADTHDVKNCAGCNIPIERAEGCNHVTCTQCGTHMCWVCSETFPKGNGIYNHMRVEHGGIGLPEWELF